MDQSTQQEIPYHLYQCLSSLKNRNGFCTQFDAMIALVISSALESGFIGEWNVGDNLNEFALSFNYSFDRSALIKNSKLPYKIQFEEGIDEIRIIFSYTLSRKMQIILEIIRSADLIIIIARHRNEISSIKSTKSAAFSVSRYIIRTRIPEECFASSFQNLKEFSIKIKNQIFLPLRDEIYSCLDCKMCYPSLLGIPDDILILIFEKYLKTKDICSLSLCCKQLHQISSPYLNNKSKIE